MTRWRRETILDIYTVLLAAFLFLAPWVFHYGRGAARADDWMSSAFILAVAAAAVLAFAEWEEWASLMLGLWVFVSPWLLGFAHTKAMHINVAVGLIIMFMSALELWLIHYDPPRPDATDRYVT
ncbi:MAG TPA: SPW repeat protein [Xanthobacteraceae bacterium]|nr:SPW repeat protein [Xanthobacteraceae bacterium]